jgi:hypothetical protein
MKLACELTWSLKAQGRSSRGRAAISIRLATSELLSIRSRPRSGASRESAGHAEYVVERFSPRL